MVSVTLLRKGRLGEGRVQLNQKKLEFSKLGQTHPPPKMTKIC